MTLSPHDLRRIASQCFGPQADLNAMMSKLHVLAFEHGTKQSFQAFANPYLVLDNRRAVAAFIRAFLPDYHGTSTFGPDPNRCHATVGPIRDSNMSPCTVQGTDETLCLIAATLQALADKLERDWLKVCPECTGTGRVLTASGVERCTAHLQAGE